MTRKETVIGEIDATPDKKVIMSISKDIDLKRGICEMIDNSIDNWRINGRAKLLNISLDLDEGSQEIEYSDNAGGIPDEYLHTIIQPGGTERTTEQETIGIFGVGSKRALIALSTESETISRHGNGPTYMVRVTDDWLEKNEWTLPKFQVDDISSSSTIFILRKLRFVIDSSKVEEVRNALAETYCYYLRDFGVKIKVNGTMIQPKIFDSWAYPPERGPRHYNFSINVEKDEVRCSLLVGLMLESSQLGEYGFDIFCNDRMILKNLKDYRLGFKTGEFGLPHPTAARFKGILRINGKNKLMPWNSTKSDIDLLNPSFYKIAEKVIKLAKPFVQLSRRFSGTEELVKPYTSGKIVSIDIGMRSVSDIVSIEVPPGKVTYLEKARKENKEIISQAPWARGLLENVIATDLILKSKLQNKNRYALILLDSCIEITFKEYIVNVLKHELNKDKTKFREYLVKHLKDKTDFDEALWDKLNYYYGLRNQLYHERATPTLPTEDIIDFRQTVCTVLGKLLNLTFDFSVDAPFLKVEQIGEEEGD